MRYLYVPALSLIRCATLMAILVGNFTIVRAQTPTPSPDPIPNPGTPILPQSPTQPSQLEHAAELQMKPQYRNSDIKPVEPLFDPGKENIFLTGSTYRTPTRLKIGAYFPNSTTLRDANDSVFLTLGASLDLPPRGLTLPRTLEIYFDSAFSRDDNNSATLLGLGVGFRNYPGARSGFQVVSPRFYYGAGIGVYYLRKEINDNTDDAFQPGAKATIGFDFSEGWAIEANYTLTGKVSGTNFSGPAVAFAYRF